MSFPSFNLHPSVPAHMKQFWRVRPTLVLAVIVVLAFAWRAVFIYRPIDWITNFWLFEDFGYSLKIARNIALGAGETFDGVVFTSGYQPLYVWLMVPVFRLFPNNLITPVYIAETLLAICNCATAIFAYLIVSRVTKRPWRGVVVAALWAFNLAVARNGSLGLETGLSTMMVAATMTYVVSIDSRRLAARNAFVLGALLGLSFLARVDAAFLVAATTLYFAFFSMAKRAVTAKFLARALATFVVVVAPYCIHNVIHYGAMLPTSGQVMTGKGSLLSPSVLLHSLAEFRHHAESSLYIIGRMLVGVTSVNGYVVFSDDWSMPIAVLTSVALVACVLFSYRRYTQSRREIFYLALVGAMFTGAYVFYQMMPYERYFLPAVFAWTLFVALAGTEFVDLARRHLRFPNLITALAVAVPLVSFSIGSRAKLLSEEGHVYGWYHGVQALNRIAGPGDVIGALQTGNTGYFYQQGRAINLDGVVNMSAYRAHQAGVIDRYLADNHVKFIADEGSFPLYISNDIESDHDRANFLASLSQVYANPSDLYRIYRIDAQPYAAIVQPSAAAGWHESVQSFSIFRRALVSNVPGAKTGFATDRPVDLRFVRASSAGMVNVYEDGNLLAKVDLYAAVPDPTYKFRVQGDGRMHHYSVEVANEANADSTGHWVTFDAILERNVQ